MERRHYIPFYKTLSVEVGDHEPLCRGMEWLFGEILVSLRTAS